MKYRVHGVSRTTAQETSIVVEAPSRQEAEKIAQRSLVVAEIELAGDDPRPAKQADEVVAAAAIWGRQGQSRGHQASPPPSVRYDPPEYGGIVTGAAVLRVVALLCYVMAALSVIILLLSRGPDSPVAGYVNAFECIVAALTNFVTGAVLHLLSSLSLAVRDIARNSFR